MIKLRFLRWTDQPRLSSKVQHNHKSPYGRETGGHREDMVTEVGAAIREKVLRMLCGWPDRGRKGL